MKFLKSLFPKQSVLEIAMLVICTLFIVYLASSQFRLFIENQNFDAGIASAFVASLALIYSVRQSILDKKFAYNSSIVSRIEDVGSIIIGKLLKIDNNAEIFIHTAENIKMCIDTGKVYGDVNNILEKFDLGSDSDKVASYIQIYFPSEHENWNEILRISGEIGSIISTIYGNYYHPANDYGKVKNQTLSNLGTHIDQLHKLKKELGEKPQDMAANIIEIINKKKSIVRKQSEV